MSLCTRHPNTQESSKSLFFRREPNTSAEQRWDCSSCKCWMPLLSMASALTWQGSEQSRDTAPHSLLADKAEGHGISHTLPSAPPAAGVERSAALHSAPCRASCWEEGDQRSCILLTHDPPSHPLQQWRQPRITVLSQLSALNCVLHFHHSLRCLLLT